jgi:hypothetical protein
VAGTQEHACPLQRGSSAAIGLNFHKIPIGTPADRLNGSSRGLAGRMRFPVVSVTE